MNDKAFRGIVILALIFICIAEGIQAVEAVGRWIRREQVRSHLIDIESATRTALLGPDVKTVWHQVYVQSQATTEYLKVIAAK